jgi:hypothetical protein
LSNSPGHIHFLRVCHVGFQHLQVILQITDALQGSLIAVPEIPLDALQVFREARDGGGYV